LMEQSRLRGGEPVTTELISIDDRISFRDEDGSMCHYNSVNDMPPHVRALYEQFRELRDDGSTE
ncbi:MAG: hypothetical protein SGI88_00050, partial [Candidatus Hydrogenedentes bacterium]|nr:hypothetical protein [Candidatus Hydrogenedentota bacterium]